MVKLNSDSTITVIAGGAEWVLKLNSFRAMRALGMKGPADGEGLQAALNSALQEWGGMLQLLSAGGVDVVESDLDDWQVLDVKALVEMIPAAFGLNSEVSEGEQSAPPESSKGGLSAVPSPVSISA